MKIQLIKWKWFHCLQVTFEGITGKLFTGDIAIDSVEITNGSCPGEIIL